MKRTKTGIAGLDRILNGGFPHKSDIVICGGPGTGKSISGLQYLYQGAMLGEPGLYVTIEEKPINLKEQARQFGMNFERYGNVKFLKIPVDISNYDIFKVISKEARRIGAKRIVVDSISILSINASMYKLPIKVKTKTKWAIHELQPNAIGGKYEIQQFIYIFMSRMGSLGATCVFLSDSAESGDYLTRDSVSEFACDGLIQLKMMLMGKTLHRTLSVKKMRKTNAGPEIQAMTFGRRGINIRSFEY